MTALCSEGSSPRGTIPPPPMMEERQEEAKPEEAHKKLKRPETTEAPEFEFTSSPPLELEQVIGSSEVVCPLIPYPSYPLSLSLTLTLTQDLDQDKTRQDKTRQDNPFPFDLPLEHSKLVLNVYYQYYSILICILIY